MRGVRQRSGLPFREPSRELGRDTRLVHFPRGDCDRQLVQSFRVDIHRHAIEIEKHQSRHEPRTLVPVDKCLALGDVEEIGGRLLVQTRVEKATLERGLWLRQRRSKKPRVSNPLGSTKLCDLFPMNEEYGVLSEE